MVKLTAEDTLANTTIPYLKNTQSLIIQNCKFLNIKPGPIRRMKDLRNLQINNISHLSIEKEGLSVPKKRVLHVMISNSVCDNYLPKFSTQDSYETFTWHNVKVLQKCSCDHDATHYHCQIYNPINRELVFQNYSDFDHDNCDHTHHHHSIFDDFSDNYLPNNKYYLIGKKSLQIIT